jgi:hypothetical protein
MRKKFLLLILLLLAIGGLGTILYTLSGTTGPAGNPNMTTPAGNNTGDGDYVGVVPVVPGAMGSIATLITGLGGCAYLASRTKRG